VRPGELPHAEHGEERAAPGDRREEGASRRSGLRGRLDLRRRRSRHQRRHRRNGAGPGAAEARRHHVHRFGSDRRLASSRPPCGRRGRGGGGGLAAREEGRARHRSAARVRHRHARPLHGDARLRRGERLEGEGQLGGVRVALGGVLLQTALHHVDHRLGNVGAKLGERLRRLGHHLEDELGHRLGLVGPPPREKLEEHHPEGPHVRARVDVARGAHLLRGHVERRAEHGPRLGEAPAAGAVPERLGHAEVEHLHPGAAADGSREEEVLRLEIAVNDARGVRLGHRLASLGDVLGDHLDGERARVAQHGAEIRAFQVLHDHVGRARLQRPHVEHLGGVLALELHRRARLANEARDRVLVAERLVPHELDGDALIQLLVPRCDDHPHAPHAQDALHAILAREEVALFDGARAGLGHRLYEYHAWQASTRRRARLPLPRTRRRSRHGRAPRGVLRFPACG
jgi:hypothetical protein